MTRQCQIRFHSIPLFSSLVSNTLTKTHCNHSDHVEKIHLFFQRKLIFSRHLGRLVKLPIIKMKQFILLLAIVLFANAVVGRAVSKKEEEKQVEDHHGQQDSEDVAVSQY